MADYSRYKTETLVKMRDRAYEKYCAETTKPQGNWGEYETCQTPYALCLGKGERTVLRDRRRAETKKES